VCLPQARAWTPLRAAADLGFSFADAIVIGDKPSDIELGQRIGARSALVKAGHGASYFESRTVAPDLVVNDLDELACLLSQGELSPSQ